MNELLKLQLEDETRSYLSDKTISLYWGMILVLLIIIFSCLALFGFMDEKKYFFSVAFSSFCCIILNSRMNAKRSKQKKYQIEYLNSAMEKAEKDIASYNTKMLESIEKKELLRSQLIELLAKKKKKKSQQKRKTKNQKSTHM